MFRGDYLLENNSKNPKVFISYTHDSQNHLNRVLAFSNKLRTEGIDAILDQYEESPTEGWPRWMDRQIRNADYVIMICTPLYFKRVMGEENPGVGLGGIWESGLIYQHLYNDGGINNKFIPVLFSEGSSYQDIPTPLQGATHYIADNDSSFDKLYWRLRGVNTAANKPPLGQLRPLEEKERKTMFVTSLIDIELWDKATWRGCAYLYTPDATSPPAIALLFENEVYARKIANQWKDWLTEAPTDTTDINEELRLSIIDTNLKGSDAGYFVTVGTNIDGVIKRYEKSGIKIDQSELYLVVSRIHFMNTTVGTNHRQVFIEHYHKFHQYFVRFGFIKNNEIHIINNLLLKKTSIELRHISDVTKDDLDAAVLPRYKEFTKEKL